MTRKLTLQNGAPKSLPTATAADIGNGGVAVAPRDNQDMAAPSPTSTAAKNGKQNTGKGSRVKLPVSDLLQIWQQATHDLKAAGLPVSVGNNSTRCIILLDGVQFNRDTGNFELIDTGNQEAPPRPRSG